MAGYIVRLFPPANWIFWGGGEYDVEEGKMLCNGSEGKVEWKIYRQTLTPRNGREAAKRRERYYFEGTILFSKNGNETNTNNPPLRLVFYYS